MSILFESTEINGMKLANRFVRSATWEGLAAQDGSCTEELVGLIGRLAAGGVGLIISSHAYVGKEGQAGPRQIGIYENRLVDGLREMARAAHRYQSRIAVQIAHAGFFAQSRLTGRTPLAPSMVERFGRSPRKEMSREDIREVVESFGRAAQRAKDAGFDAVQIHAAHGYLLSQFLSPAFNRRTDEYGGSIENRSRFLVEVLNAVRDTVGKDFPVLIKMNSQDYLEGGLTSEDALEAGILLQKEGVDAIELSGGTVVSGKQSPSRSGITGTDKEAYFRRDARAFRERLDIPIILVGGNRSFETAERLVMEGYADYISMSRPLIREPDLIRRWASGDRRPAACISDNQCFGPAMAGEGIYCVVERKQGKKAEGKST